MWPLVLTIALLGFGALRILQLYLRWVYSPLRKIPGPPLNDFLLGYFLEIRREPFSKPVRKWWHQAGYDSPMLHVTTVMGGSSLYILDRDIVKEILTAPAGKGNYRFGKGLEFLATKVGDGLVSLNGEPWMRHRRIIQSAFHVNFLKESLMESVVPRVSTFIQYWRLAVKNSVGEGKVREIHLTSHLSALTLDVMGDVSFSHNFNAISGVKEWAESGSCDEYLDQAKDPFVSTINKCLKFTVFGTLFYITNWKWGDRNLNPNNLVLRRHLTKAMDDIIENARRQNSLGKPKSLLQLLLRAKVNGDADQKGTNGVLSSSELRDEMATFLIAGHETTSVLCHWAIYALCKYPDVQQRIYKEIESANNLDLDTVEGLTYFEAFLSEVQRFYPPVGFFRRINRFDEEFGGFKIPAKTRMIIPVFLLHRHPKYWDDPERFLPERWIHQDDEARQKFLDRTRFAFIPFSAGGRNCVGQRFAIIEAKLILAHLIRAFSFRIAPSQAETDFSLTNYITMKTKPGVKISLKCRD